ncbi:hypothetical protein [Pseudoduganella sp.]|uniref:hypothetical protein n=1 Tax=Pseudoduganella sp. TaxID=1880898 RepID=UPI0035B3A005
MRAVVAGLCWLAANGALLAAPPGQAQEEALPVVQVAGLADPDEQTYKRLLKGVQAFEQHRQLAPQASLRYRLVPRVEGVKLAGIEVALQGEGRRQPLALDERLAFDLPRDERALQEGARVVTNRKSRSFAWVPEVRTPGLPPQTRRLGDLRLECQIDRAASLLVGYKPPAYLVLELSIDVCSQGGGNWLYYADRPLFNVTLVDGARRQPLFARNMYGSPIPAPLHIFYDFHPLLVDRTYIIKLSDTSWPDDTLVELEYMEDTPQEPTP